MTILHQCWDLSPTNGAANIARLFVAEQRARGDDARLASSWSKADVAQADEIWLHCGWYPRHWTLARLARKLGKRLVWLPEACSDPVRLNYHAWKKRLAGFFERRALRRADLILATCPAEAEWIRAYVGKGCPPVEVTDVKRFFSFRPPAPSSARGARILYLGRPHPLKGTSYLMEAVAGANADRPADRALELHLVSDKTGAALEAEWAWADVLCLPTLSDNFGLVVAEALSRGKRVVTTDGAPAWADDPRVSYLQGYRDGAPATRVKLLRDAFSAFLLALFAVLPASAADSLAEGPFEPTWESLSRYGGAPEWFKDAKFGIWAHWGPQCQPEQGDWYARQMYMPGMPQNAWHVAHYGSPARFGFKDVINSWKAEKWNPDELVAFYKKIGARYFFAMGNHHDNFDLWDSSHQPWNSVNMGPKKDILAGWAKAARANGLKFGVSIHSAHAWTWYEVARPYDGLLTKEDGKGTWWEGYDPQDLYVQNHPPSDGPQNNKRLHEQWRWGNGAALPTEAYCENFLKRTIEMIDSYSPDMIYFDDTAAPLWPVSDVGLKVFAHLYNKSVAENKGTCQSIVFGKVLTDEQKNAVVWDVERGIPDRAQERYCQCDTCLGSWHYSRPLYDKDGYKSARTVVCMLIDIISKNGNLLLSVPIRGNGEIDEKERAILEEIGAWFAVNAEGVYATRSWRVTGEGPMIERAENPKENKNFSEGRFVGFTANDIRYVAKGPVVYAHVMGWPEAREVTLAAFASEPVGRVTLLGHAGPLPFSQDASGLHVVLPAERPNPISFVLRIE